MKFQDLNISNEVMKAIEDLGFETATEIQEKSLLPLLEGNDLIGQSATGSGKTLAFAVPTIEKINESIKKPQTIILCPTRELAVQVSNEFKKLLKYLHGIKVCAVYGGEPIVHQIKKLKSGPQIIVGTPGRVMDHMRRKTIKMDFVDTVVLDEADEMLNMGFREDIEYVLDHVKEERQFVLFSATMPKAIVNIASEYQNEPVRVTIKSSALTTDTIEQRYMLVKESFKMEVLSRMIDLEPAKLSLIFCNTKRKVDELCHKLQEKGYLCDKIHGDMKQTQRLDVLAKFNKGIVNILIATDVAARGIDINDIDCVYNYDIPENEEYYVHRIGRTGRAGRKGKSFGLVSRGEVKRLKDIVRYIKRDIEPMEIPSAKSVNNAQIVKYLQNIDSVIENETLTDYVEIIENHLETGHSAIEIAAALLSQSLNLKEDKSDKMSFSDDYSRGSNSDVSRLFLNIGKNQNLKPKDIIGAINSHSSIRGIEVGSIDIFDKYTFINVPEGKAKEVVKALHRKRIRGFRVNIEIAKGKAKGNGGGRRRSNNRRRNDNRRNDNR